MDAVAQSSGVSKATIYKHWADKDALLLEMMAHLNGLHARPAFDSGDTRADIHAVLAYRPPDRVSLRERLMPHLMAYATKNPPFGIALRNMVMEPPRRELTRLLQQGMSRGELEPDLDIDVCLAMLLGPIMYWHVLLKGTPVDTSKIAESVADMFWKAFALKKTRAR